MLELALDGTFVLSEDRIRCGSRVSAANHRIVDMYPKNQRHRWSCMAFAFPVVGQSAGWLGKKIIPAIIYHDYCSQTNIMPITNRESILWVDTNDDSLIQSVAQTRFCISSVEVVLLRSSTKSHIFSQRRVSVLTQVGSMHARAKVVTMIALTRSSAVRKYGSRSTKEKLRLCPKHWLTLKTISRIK